MVTGSWVRRNLRDEEVELAIAEIAVALARTTSSEALRRGILMLPTTHAETDAPLGYPGRP